MINQVYASLDEEPREEDLMKVDPLAFVQYRKYIGDIRKKNLQ